MLNDKKIFIMGIFLALVGSYEDYIVYFGYIVLAFFSGIALLIRLIKEINLFEKNKGFGVIVKTHGLSIDAPLLLCTFVLLSWFYGITIGIFNGVKPESVLRNFFGLSLYIIFPIYLVIRPAPVSVAKVIVAAGVLQLLLALYSFKPDLISDINFSELLSVSDIRSSYSASYIVIFPLFAGSFGLLLFNIGKLSAIGKFISFILFVFSFISLTVITASKGFILAVFFTMIICAVAWIKEKKMFGALFAMLLVGILLFFLLFTFRKDFFYLMVQSFSLSEGGNSIREEQAFALINEISFWGAGLGSSLSSGYKRDDSGYGFELTYLNLLHKLGIFSIPLFLLYIYTCIQSFRWLMRDYRNILPYICLGGCCYMIVGIGNPLLLSSLCVTLHCSILYLIVTMKGKI
jgi:hypothetical protein